MPVRTLLLLMALAVLLPVRAYGQTDPHSPKADAEAHYQTAVRLFGEGRYREALDEFDAAIALSPESIFYCNRAIVLIQLTEVEEALESLETCQRTFTGDPSELAAIDAQRQGVAQAVRTVRPTTFDTISAMTTPVVIQEGSAGGWTRASTGYVLLALGGALIASAATFDVLSAPVRNELDRLAAGPKGATEEEFEEALANYRSQQRIWLLLAGGGALTTLTGAVLVLTHWVGSGDSGAEVTAEIFGGGGFGLRFVTSF